MQRRLERSSSWRFNSIDDSTEPQSTHHAYNWVGLKSETMGVGVHSRARPNSCASWSGDRSCSMFIARGDVSRSMTHQLERMPHAATLAKLSTPLVWIFSFLHPSRQQPRRS